ncbi:hypothetical protein BD324DRAFT_645413 [Kockovaella imperatae]|uniref:Mg-dependent DNase n=1 Tax=Kockovaella imperatae TaxID=4999 RepID=A0A1Y1ULE2_9TREE|nr:hypothetical protein BD324DRAFT_645413 [Kockovaella imperatae]ORX37935.1 hypothetical protein BD324DRAFT_645413 [Kockovaella imperatae]
MASRYIDIAVNLTDPQWSGSYHGKQRHPSDIEQVLSRAKRAGVQRILITGTSLEESKIALELAKKFSLHCTAGCHPTQTNELDQFEAGPSGYIDGLRALIETDQAEGGSKRIVSVGEIGLDYDRLHFCSKETQQKHLPALLGLGKQFRLPMFLHSRTSEAHHDFVKILREAGWGTKGESWAGGVVHSFTGTKEEVEELVDMGLYIGINGCSLKTEQNLEVVKHIPIDRLLLETDSPWCSITSTHASYALFPEGLPQISDHGIKGRMEPAEVVVIAHLVAKLKGMDVEELSRIVWDNTMRLFPGMQ